MERIKFYINKFCSWGVKRRVKLSKDQVFDGFTAPLWTNSAPKIYLTLAIWSFILFVALTITMAAGVGNDPVCDFNYKSLIITQIVLVFLDCIQEILFFNKKVASDTQWSRYLIVLTFTTATMIILGIVSMIIGLAEIGTTTTECPDGIEKTALWRTNIAAAVNIFLYSLGKLALLIYSGYKYFRGNTMLAYKHDNAIITVEY